jgi:hypothetical protein
METQQDEVEEGANGPTRQRRLISRLRATLNNDGEFHLISAVLLSTDRHHQKLAAARPNPIESEGWHTQFADAVQCTRSFRAIYRRSPSQNTGRLVLLTAVISIKLKAQKLKIETQIVVLEASGSGRTIRS